MEPIKYEITNCELRTRAYGDEGYLLDWPMVYILTGKDSKGSHKDIAYVGESINASKRMAQHIESPDKKEFNETHFVYSSRFNKSVTLDFESKLIQLMSSDGKYLLTNKNSGIQDGNYYEKDVYRKSFYDLWEELKKAGLVKQNIKEIENSDLFKYSPYKELNADQEKAVEEIFNLITSKEKRPVIVEGAPGTGKTIVAIYLMKYLRDYMDDHGEYPYRKYKTALVISPTSLRSTIKKLFKQIYGFKASDVIGPSELKKKHYDIAFIDEAHRLHQKKAIINHKAHAETSKALGLPLDATELDWALKQADVPVLFFDNDQVIGPSGVNASLMASIMSKAEGKEPLRCTLATQMRVQGADDYLDYVKDLLAGKTTEKQTFSNYEFKLVNDFQKFNDLLIEKEREVGLARMVGGFAWPWVSKTHPEKFDISIEGIEKRWNTQLSDWVNSEHALEEVGSIHTVQGYDLNYGFVIIGNDLRYDPETKQVYAVKSNYFDTKGKIESDGEVLLNYLQNIYYVLMTRGIKGTFLYVCDPELRDYFNKLIYVEDSLQNIPVVNF